MFATASYNQQGQVPAAMESVAPSAIAAADEAEKMVESRFGALRINLHQKIYFPLGLLGIPNQCHYCLADLPNPKMARFKVLQNVQDDNLSFLVMPMGIQNSIIEEPDIEEVRQIMGIPANSLALLLIVTVHRSLEEVKLSVNARAPILVDVNQKEAAQFVFPHSKYQIRHML
jgi:flagellar assembly factor FliW